MIKNTSFTEQAFLSALSRPWGGIRSVVGEDGILYLGGGYWRARIVRSARERCVGACLINPDKSPAEIGIAEQGLAVVLSLEYDPAGADDE